MKILKFNQKGITHILAPLAFIAVFAAVGAFVLLKSHAAGVPNSVDGYIYQGGVGVTGAKVVLHNKSTGTNSTTYSLSASKSPTGGVGFYIFYNASPKTTYSMQASKVIGCTKFYSSYRTFTTGANGSIFYSNLSLNNSTKIC